MTRTVQGTMQARYRIGFDIGGTFTDFILQDAGRRHGASA